MRTVPQEDGTEVHPKVEHPEPDAWTMDHARRCRQLGEALRRYPGRWDAQAIEAISEVMAVQQRRIRFERQKR